MKFFIQHKKLFSTILIGMMAGLVTFIPVWIAAETLKEKPPFFKVWREEKLAREKIEKGFKEERNRLLKIINDREEKESKEVALRRMEDEYRERKIIEEACGTERPPNIYPIYCMKEGDKFGGMVIESMSGARRGEIIEVPEEYNLPTKHDFGILFSGAIEITGNYERYAEDTAFFRNEVCITSLDEPSKNLLPTPYDEEDEDPFFCLNIEGNDESWKNKFGPPGTVGKATVIIDTYSAARIPMEVWDHARLQKVISVSYQ